MTDMEKMLVKANNVEEEKYPELVEKKLRKSNKNGRKYPTSGSEIAILRKTIKHIATKAKITLPKEFTDYFNDVEEVKEEAKGELYG